MFDFFGANQHHRNLDSEFRKLLCEPCQKVPKEGDTVIVASGLLNMGHPWIRLEAKVLATAETSIKVRFEDRFGDGEHADHWIHPVLIVDVL